MKSKLEKITDEKFKVLNHGEAQTIIGGQTLSKTYQYQDSELWPCGPVDCSRVQIDTCVKF